MKNWTVKRRIIFGFSAVILIMITLSVVSAVHLTEIKGQAISITSKTWPGLYVTSKIESLAGDTFTSFEKYVLTANGEGKHQAEAEIDSNTSKLDSLMKEYEGTISNDEDRRRFTSLSKARTTCETAFKPVAEWAKRHCTVMGEL